MPKIKFSHAYEKLMIPDSGIFSWAPTRTATLLQVVSITLDQLSKPFVDYDTDNGKYKLAYNTLYMMLIFQRSDGNIFTTLRSQFNPRGNKLPYYQGLVGQKFEVIIELKEVPHG